MLKKHIKFGDTDKTIWKTLRLFCIKMFPKAIPIRRRSLKKFNLRKIAKLPKNILSLLQKNVTNFAGEDII